MPVSLLFLGLAAICTGLGLFSLSLGAWGFSLASIWPAVGFVFVSIAYMRRDPSMLGKRQDGTINPWVVAALLPFFVLTWCIWQALRRSGERCWDQIAPGLYLGRRPYAHELPSDVSLVVDLTAEFPRPKGTASCRYLCLPTLDAAAPPEDACRRLVAELAGYSQPVYIHCAQGHGRSAVVAGLLLIRRGLAPSAQDAEAMMRAARPGVNLSRAQREALARLSQ